MKIAHIIFSLNTGGTETMLIDIVNEQCKTNSVALLIVNNKVNEELVQHIDDRVVLHRINRKQGSRDLLPLLKLNRTLGKFKADVIHCHNHNAINAFLPIFRKKALLTLHTTDIPTLNLHKYKKLFAISDSVSHDVELRTGLRPRRIYNGVLFDAIEQKKQIEHTQQFKIVQIGRLEHQVKGQDLLLKAVEALKSRGYQDITVDFIGEGSSLKYLSDLVKTSALHEQITFLGHMDRAHIYKNLKNYDLLVQPSLIEGFGLTIAEALAARIPVLISDLAGPMEVIHYGKYGDFFTKENVNNLADKILEIMTRDKDLISTNALDGFKYSIEKFDIRKTALSYLNEYAAL